MSSSHEKEIEFWEWEQDQQFDQKMQEFLENRSLDKELQWVKLNGENTADPNSEEGIAITDEVIKKVIERKAFGDPEDLCLRDPKQFRAGEVHRHLDEWEKLVGDNPSFDAEEVLSWIKDKVSIFQYLQPFKGSFQGKFYDSETPPKTKFKNNMICKDHRSFIGDTIIERLSSKAVSLVGKVEESQPPHIVLPLKVEPTKPRLIFDARFVNCWTEKKEFTSDKITDLLEYVGPGTDQAVLDDKSAYDHLLLTEDSRQYFGFQWGGWYFQWNTLPFGWSLSPYIYTKTGLLAKTFFSSIGIPSSLYIDDRHIGQLKIPDDEQNKYTDLRDVGEKNLQAANSAIFVVVSTLVKLGYFLNPQKYQKPNKSVRYLGFVSDSSKQAFSIVQDKRDKFIAQLNEVLEMKIVEFKDEKIIENIFGKCRAYSLVIPARVEEMRRALYRKNNNVPIHLHKKLKRELKKWKTLLEINKPRQWQDIVEEEGRRKKKKRKTKKN